MNASKFQMKFILEQETARCAAGAWATSDLYIWVTAFHAYPEEFFARACKKKWMINHIIFNHIESSIRIECSKLPSLSPWIATMHTVAIKSSMTKNELILRSIFDCWNRNLELAFFIWLIFQQIRFLIVSESGFFLPISKFIENI